MKASIGCVAPVTVGTAGRTSSREAQWSLATGVELLAASTSGQTAP